MKGEFRGLFPAHSRSSYQELLIASVVRVSIVHLGLSSTVLEELLAGSFSLELGFEDPEYARGSLTLDSFYQGFGRR